jgi:hypothetical protein
MQTKRWQMNKRLLKNIGRGVLSARENDGSKSS